MFFQNLQKFFFITTISAFALLVYLWYQDYSFIKNPLNKNIQEEIRVKQKELRYIAYKKLNIIREFPVIISDTMPAQRFGMTIYDRKGQIKIYLNKKRFQENSKYMITHVLPHEYAHAIMFELKDFSKVNSGHTKRWQNICIALNGLKCNRFVDNEDILIEKTNPFK